MNANVEPNIDLEFRELQSTSPVESIPKAPAGDPRYSGKSTEDIIHMHQEAEKALSRQGWELGELRRNVDTLMGLRKVEEDNSQKVRVPVTATDLLDNPDQTLETAINQSSVAQTARTATDKVEALERQLGQNQFETRFPAYADDLGNPDFQSWVKANKLRTALLVSLDKNYDFNSGMALWELWEEKQGGPTRKSAVAPAEPEPVESQATDEVVSSDPVMIPDIRRARVVKSTPSESHGRKPILSRVKLQELQIKAEKGDQAARAKWNDPAFQNERVQAYAEGRVK